ncbi:hypothetical protein P3T37_000721 [Kitasatospora sp. MAA4]|nr:hypothetical protein [Kitasatospora sp. MAA4]
MHAHQPEQAPDVSPSRPPEARSAVAVPGPSGDLSPAAVLALQRSVGNAAVSRLLSGTRPAPVQRSAVHDVLRSSGRPLDAPIRSEMEDRLGADFSDVRLHTGEAAQRSAAEIGARAYTSGHHVVIGPGGADKHTLAHELTHVIQQRHGPVAGADNGSGLAVSDPSDRFEREAEANASRAPAAPAAQRTAAGASAQRAIVQRFYDPAVTAANRAAATGYLEANTRAIMKRFHTMNETFLFSTLTLAECVQDALTSQIRASPHRTAVISQMRLLTRGVPLVPDPNPDLDAAILAELVRCTNLLEEQCLTSDAARREIGDIRFGTEFTFTDLVLQGRTTTNGKKPKQIPALRMVNAKETTTERDEQAAVRAHADEIMERWETLVVTRPIKDVPTPRTSIPPGAKAGPGKGIQFNYQKGETTWYWILDIDNACLETQTMPVTVAGIGPRSWISQVIDQHIFAMAAEAGVRPDTTVAGGSGHISVDMDTAFGGSVTLFTKTLQSLQRNVDDWDRRFHRTAQEGYDKRNSPWLKDLGLGKSTASAVDTYHAVIARIAEAANRGDLDIARAMEQLIAFNRELDNKELHSGSKDDREMLADMGHYQAVNIEHAAEGDGRARLELRDIPAQTGLARLREDLTAIQAFLQSVRRSVTG